MAFGQKAPEMIELFPRSWRRVVGHRGHHGALQVCDHDEALSSGGTDCTDGSSCGAKHNSTVDGQFTRKYGS